MRESIKPLTIFYDGLCPLCSAEINQLKIYDTDKKLIFEDINSIDFSQKYPHIDKAKANRILHGQLSNSDMLYGLDVTCLAWKNVGKHRWLAILRWPIIRWFADLAYALFARHRNRISSLLIRNENTCNPCGARKNSYIKSNKRC